MNMIRCRDSSSADGSTDRSTHGRLLALGFAVAMLALPATAAQPPVAGPHQHFEHQGVVIDFDLERSATAAAEKVDAPLREGEPVRFRFTIRDSATGSSLGSIYPAAWGWTSNPRPSASAPIPARRRSKPSSGAASFLLPSSISTSTTSWR